MLRFDIEGPIRRNVTFGDRDAASASTAGAPSRADSESDEEEQQPERITTRPKSAEHVALEEPSRVRCYVHYCDGTCSDGQPSGVHGNTLFQSSSCSSVVPHTPAENQLFLQSGPVRLASELQIGETDPPSVEHSGDLEKSATRPEASSGSAPPSEVAALSALTLCVPTKSFYAKVLDGLQKTYSLESNHLEERASFCQLHYEGNEGTAITL